MPCYQIHIQGQVQGVGFRPHVYRLATRLGLTGWVSNASDGVHIQIAGVEDACHLFIDQLLQRPPARARITNHRLTLAENQHVPDFNILESTETGKPNLLVTPDLGLCETCRNEVNDSNDRRYGYAFTTCINCGPRYSVIQALPYDRAHTTMADFEQCPDCKREYHDPKSRRYFSQTNSCAACGVQMQLLDASRNELSADAAEVIGRSIQLLEQGKILAVKGIGGYLLLADAANTETIELLRARKHRPRKPFALLYPTIELVKQDAVVTPAEEVALRSIESPLVLLGIRSDREPALALDQIAPGLRTIGVMLPYSPLLELMAGRFKKPLVATSGNVSGSPIFYKDEEAIKNLSTIADFFVTNNREIVVPQDDSVVRFTNTGQRIVLRRSRGFAPTYLPNPIANKKQSVLAAGADLKSAFGLLTEGNLYVSQYLGDLENYETQEEYRHTQTHLLNLLKAKPQQVLVDYHPAYFSSKLGGELAATWEVPLKKVQHHLAHFSAVLAENNLLHTSEPVLGIIWDGTGWGTDGHVWGGEFFTFSDRQFKRVHHLDYFDHLLGDKTSREPRLSALCLCEHLNEADGLLREKFTDGEWKLYKAMLSHPQNLQTSSVGRLFDGVAALLGLCDKSTYEGEAAMYLETCARKACIDDSAEEAFSNFSLRSYLKNLISQIEAGVAKEVLAYRFHRSLVKWIEEIAQRASVQHLAFSGGVFQNALLVELIQKTLAGRYELHFHRQLSPNDECISLGQLAYEQIQSDKKAIQAGTYQENINQFSHVPLHSR